MREFIAIVTITPGEETVSDKTVTILKNDFLVKPTNFEKNGYGVDIYWLNASIFTDYTIAECSNITHNNLNYDLWGINVTDGNVITLKPLAINDTSGQPEEISDNPTTETVVMIRVTDFLQPLYPPINVV